jgi:excisionase family DNA binding protein
MTCYPSPVSSVEAPISLPLPPSVIEAIAQRVAPIVAELIRSEGVASESEFLSVEEAAELMRSTPGRVRNLITSGQLVPDAYNGRRPLLSRVQVRAWMKTVDTLAPAEQLRRRAA